MKKFFRSFRNIRAFPAVTVAVAVLLVPFVLCFVRASDVYNRLRVFSDALLIEGLVLIVLGILLSFFNQGDLDITRYKLIATFQRDIKPYEAYKKDMEEKHGGAFNYPLVAGLFAVLLSTLTALLMPYL